MELFKELIEDKDVDEKILKSFRGKDSLSPIIFDNKDNDFFMHPEIREQLIKIADHFINTFGIDIFIHDIVLTGSLANYNWSEYSDIDLHVIVDFNELTDSKSKGLQEVFKEFFNAKKTLWNEKHSVTIKGYDVEVYVQDIEEPHISSGVYSILNNKWIIEPEKNDPKIDVRKILDKGEFFANQIDSLEKRYESGEDILSDLERVVEKIKKTRQSGLNRDGEYSYENLAFKLLRRNGYIKKIIDLKKNFTDKKLSIDENDF